MYMSAVIHDYGHKGVNNDFLVKTQDDLAVQYNGLAVQFNDAGNLNPPLSFVFLPIWPPQSDCI